MKGKITFDESLELMRNNVTYLLNTRNMTVAEMAPHLGVSATVVYRWLAGKAFPSAKLMYGASTLFNVSLDSLFFTDLATEEQPKAITVGPDLSPNESLALSMFQSLNRYDQDTVLRVITAMLPNNTAATHEIDTIVDIK